jgi:hypothetical protein
VCVSVHACGCVSVCVTCLVWNDWGDSERARVVNKCASQVQTFYSVGIKIQHSPKLMIVTKHDTPTICSCVELVLSPFKAVKNSRVFCTGFCGRIVFGAQ